MGKHVSNRRDGSDIVLTLNGDLDAEGPSKRVSKKSGGYKVNL